MALDERNDLVAQVSAPSRPLVVGTSAVVIRAVEPASRIGPPEPLEGLFVTDVHAERDLGLAAVASEMALADEQAHEKSRRKVIRWARCRFVHTLTVLEGCFTVKFSVEQSREAYVRRS